LDKLGRKGGPGFRFGPQKKLHKAALLCLLEIWHFGKWGIFGDI
jgi:hypothetical protein